MGIKMLKNVNDSCYAKQYKKVDQCDSCWIDNACCNAYRTAQKHLKEAQALKDGLIPVKAVKPPKPKIIKK